MSRTLIGSPDEEFYADVADELNDGNESDLTLDDLDPEYLRRAEAFARLNDLPWPPQVGDFDRYVEMAR